MSWETIAGIADVASNLFNTGYNVYTNQRDFDYQKALQQQMFEREDTAVQRRMQDLKAAGINPNLAAGSAAGAGSVVSRSNSNDLNIGSFADTLSAINQIRQQRQQVQNLKTEGDILNNQKQQIEFDKNLDMYSTLSALGFDVNPNIYLDNKGNYGFDFDVGYNLGENLLYDASSGKTYYKDAQRFRNMILGNMNNQYDSQHYSTELLKKDYDWYTTDKVSGLILGGLNLAVPRFNFSKRMK